MEAMRIQFLIAACLALTACKVSGSVDTTGPQVKGPFTTKPTETSIPPAPQAVTPDTAEFYVTWGMPKVAKGDRLKAALVAIDVGTAAPPNTVVLETEVEVPDDGAHWGNFTFKKPPAAGWPRGKYRVDVSHGSSAIGQVSFAVE